VRRSNIFNGGDHSDDSNSHVIYPTGIKKNKKQKTSRFTCTVMLSQKLLNYENKV